mmetsp:Transcript_5202/g.21313  ORF Transcript_5202/g.21313 Transcript_5202/m.21313 type:complete len:211 (+) Transcript_5202:1509-2141(+)
MEALSQTVHARWSIPGVERHENVDRAGARRAASCVRRSQEMASDQARGCILEETRRSCVPEGLGLDWRVWVGEADQARPLHALRFVGSRHRRVLRPRLWRQNHAAAAVPNLTGTDRRSSRIGENVGKEGGGERSELRFCTRRVLRHAGRITQVFLGSRARSSAQMARLLLARAGRARVPSRRDVRSPQALGHHGVRRRSAAPGFHRRSSD